MAKKTQGRRSRPRKQRRPAPPRHPPPGPTLVTPEGDPLVFAHARYSLAAGVENQHAAMDEIAQRLAQANDFGEGDEVELEPGMALQFPWYETEPGAKPPPDPMDRRVLAMVTLTADELEVETMSQQRMARCRRGWRTCYRHASTWSRRRPRAQRRCSPSRRPWMPPSR